MGSDFSSASTRLEWQRNGTAVGGSHTKLEADMDVVVKGRHCAVSEAFRAYVEEKITRL